MCICMPPINNVWTLETVCSCISHLKKTKSLLYSIPGFAGGARETGEQCEEIWCCDPSTSERVSSVSVRLT